MQFVPNNNLLKKSHHFSGIIFVMSLCLISLQLFYLPKRASHYSLLQYTALIAVIISLVEIHCIIVTLNYL